MRLKLRLVPPPPVTDQVPVEVRSSFAPAAGAELEPA